MKVLVDTSVLVPALLEIHPNHATALKVLAKGRTKELDVWVAAHSLAEAYSVLTTFPRRPRVSPADARQAIREGVETVASIVSLETSEYLEVLQEISEAGLSGGVVYDALLVRAARKANVDRILTYNIDDFRRVWPEGADRIAAP